MKTTNQYISIPFKVMKDTRLTQTQKLIYGFVAGFKVSKKICYASNSYIADVVCLKERAVSKAINVLIKDGWLGVNNPKGRSRSLFCLYPGIQQDTTEVHRDF